MNTTFYTALIFVLTMCAAHEKPSDYKRGKLKTFGAWLLLILAGLNLFAAFFLANHELEIYNEFDYALAVFTDVIEPGIVLFGWAIYIFKSGPLRSKIWKRVVKSILYSLLSFITLGSVQLGVIAMLLAFGLYIAIGLVDATWNVKLKWTAVGEYVLKSFVTCVLAGFFVLCGFGFFTRDFSAVTIFFFIYAPWFLILLVYYTYLLWRRGPVKGESILLLPLLQKISLFKNYSASNLAVKKDIIRTVLPVLITSTLCPFISALIQLTNGCHGVEWMSLLLLSIPILIILVDLIITYSQKWVYNQGQQEGDKP